VKLLCNAGTLIEHLGTVNMQFVLKMDRNISYT